MTKFVEKKFFVIISKKFEPQKHRRKTVETSPKALRRILIVTIYRGNRRNKGKQKGSKTSKALLPSFCSDSGIGTKSPPRRHKELTKKASIRICGE